MSDLQGKGDKAFYGALFIGIAALLALIVLIFDPWLLAGRTEQFGLQPKSSNASAYQVKHTPRVVLGDGSTLIVRNDCDNKSTRETVQADSNVWDTMVAQIKLDDKMYHRKPTVGKELATMVGNAVEDLQNRINHDPSLKVRDLNHVPAGYQFDLAIDTSVSPVADHQATPLHWGFFIA